MFQNPRRVFELADHADAFGGRIANRGRSKPAPATRNNGRVREEDSPLADARSAIRRPVEPLSVALCIIRSSSNRSRCVTLCHNDNNTVIAGRAGRVYHLTISSNELD